ncbi:hypothetical protein NHX12_023611, partial [Muraenolepis orangiensis]
ARNRLLLRCSKCGLISSSAMSSCTANNAMASKCPNVSYCGQCAFLRRAASLPPTPPPCAPRGAGT